MKKLLVLLSLLFLPEMAFGQSTTVSGNITDADGQTWFGGTYSFTFKVSPSNPTGQYFWNGAPFSTSQTIQGALDASGNYSVSVPSNTSINPAGSTWVFQACSQASSPCFVQTFTITGATQTISPIPPGIRINMGSPPPNTTAYRDSELIAGVLGQSYFNLVDTTIHVCANLPCGWTPIGGGGGSGGGLFTPVSQACAATELYTLGGAPSSTLNTAFSLTLNCNVTSSSIAGTPRIGNVIQFTITNPGTFTHAWPTNFIGAPLVLPNTETDASFWYDGTNWHFQQLNAPNYQTIQNNTVSQTRRPYFNCIPPFQCADNAGNNRTDASLQPFANGASHQSGIVSDPGAVADLTKFLRQDNTFATPAGSGISFPINSPNPAPFNVDLSTKGPNPGIDIRQFGARFVNPLITPVAVGVTANCTNGSAVLPISAASTFVNGDGVVVYGCGAPHTMTTPAAPTLTPSVAAAPTGTGYVVNAPTGATSYSYRITARDVLGGQTAASTEVTTATGPASLGSQNVTITSITRSNNVNTATTATPHGLAVGAMIYISGTTNDSNFGGWYTVATVPDSTHFTYLSGYDTRNYAVVSATGGLVYWWNSIHLTLPTPQAGMWQYCIYGRTTGTETLIDCSGPVDSRLAGDSTYMVWDDFGATMMAGIAAQIPAFIPNTPPSSAVSDNLVTTILTGAGTTTLTLANAAGTTPAGATTVRLDAAPNILAAWNFALANGGQLYIPCGGTFATNSYLTLTTGTVGVSQCGTLSLGDTVQYNGSGFAKWNGELNNGGLSTPQFGLFPLNVITVSTAKPALYMPNGGLLQGVDFANSGNGYQDVWTNGALPVAQFRDLGFSNSTGTADYMGNAITVFCQVSAGGCAGLKLTDTLISTGPSQVNGTTATPSLVSKNAGEWTISGSFMNRRGDFFKPNAAGLSLKLDMNYEEQGGIMPLVSVYNSGSSVGGWLKVQDCILDTMAHPCLSNFAAPGNFVMTVSVDGTFGPALGIPIITGNPLGVVNGQNIAGGPLGTNTNEEHINRGTAVDGVFAQSVNPQSYATKEFNMGLHTGPAYGYAAEGSPAPAPTCVVSAGGLVPVGVHVFTVVPVEADGGEGTPSLPCTVTTTTGNQTVGVSWTQVLGAIGYNGTRDGRSVNLGSCGVPQTTALTFTDTFSFDCGNVASTIPASGPSGVRSSRVWTPALILPRVPSLTFLPLGAEIGDVNGQLSFTEGTSTVYAIPGVSSPGAVGNSICLATTLPLTYTGCPSGGGIIAAPQFAIANYTAPGSGVQIGGIPSPTAPNGANYLWQSTPAGGTATQTAPALPGLPGRTVSGATDLWAYTDRVNRIEYTNAGATAISVPQAGSTNFGNNFTARVKIRGAGASAVFTPTGGTIQGAGSLTLFQGQDCTIGSQDNSTSWADCHDPPYIAGLGISLVRSDYSVTLSSNVPYAVAGGAVNVLTATYNPAVTALTDGLELDFLPNLANTTTTPTFNPNGLGAGTITKANGAALVANDLVTTQIAKVIYKGAGWQLQNPATGGGGGGAGTVSNCTGPGIAYYSAAGTTVVCDTAVTVPTSGTLLAAFFAGSGTQPRTVHPIGNDAVTGTTANFLAKLSTTAPAAAITATTSDTAIPVYIVDQLTRTGVGAGTTGAAPLVWDGIGYCTFDSAPSTDGNYVIASTTSAGKCHDSGTNNAQQLTTPVYVIGTLRDTTAVSGSIYKVTVSPFMVTGIVSKAIVTGTAYTNGTTTFSTVQGGSGTPLQFAVGSGSIAQNVTVTCNILYQSSASTAGPKFQWIGPAAPTTIAASAHMPITTSTYIDATATAYSTAMADTGTMTTATNFMATLTFTLINGPTSGTLILQAAANGAGTLTIQPGSSCVLVN